MIVHEENIQGYAYLSMQEIGRAIGLIHGGMLTQAVEVLCGARATINSMVILPLENKTGEPSCKTL